MSALIVLDAGVNGFAEDKDEARDIRKTTILPALERNESVTLDFGAVKYATQSYIHALVGEALQKYGEKALEMVEFQNCSAPVKSVIELVVDYSLGGFAESPSGNPAAEAKQRHSS